MLLIKNGKITCVISSNPDAYALERAKNNGIPAVVVARKEYDSIECVIPDRFMSFPNYNQILY